MVRKALLLGFFISMSAIATAQDNQQVPVEEGTILTIERPVGTEYHHIHFPRKNFIIKRGGIADMKSVYGKQVEVVAYTYTDEGDAKVTLKRTDGKKFFRNFRTVDAHLEDALSSGELKK